MSISTADTEAEQNIGPRICSPTGRRVSDTRVPPNTEEDEVSSVSSGTDGRNSVIGDLADFSADEEESQLAQFSGCRIPGCQCEGCNEYMEWDSDDMTDSEDSEWEDPDEMANRLWVEQYNYDLIEGMTLMTYTPPPGKNRRRRYEDNVKYAPEVQESNCHTSDMGFLTEEESPQLEPALQLRTDADDDIPYCGDMKDNHGPQKRTRSDTYFPSGEHSEFFDRPVTESVTARVGSDTDFHSDEHSEFFDRPVTESVTARVGSDTDFPSDEHSEFFDRLVTESVTAWAESDTYFHSDEHSEFFDRPVTESVKARVGSDTDFPSGDHSEFVDRPVTESVTARVGSDTDFPSGDHSEFVDRPVTESVTARTRSDTYFHSDAHSEFFDRPVTESVMARAADTEQILVMNVSTVTTEQSELREMVLGETDKRGIPVYSIECAPERRQPENISPGALRQVEMSNNQWNCVDYCCGVCGKADSVNRSGTGSCWNCCCLIVWGYHVSWLAAMVIRDRFHGIDLFSKDRCVFTRRPELVGNPMWLCDVIRVYTKMNGNFKGGMDSVVMMSDDPVDSRYLKRCTDDGYVSLEHASVRGKPIREKGRFGCVDTPVRDADWSVEFSVGPIPVGDTRIDYLRDPIDRGQSTNAAPLSDLLHFSTLRRLRNYCAAEYIICWTFCDTVWNTLRTEGLLLRCGAFQACQEMEGAVIVDNRSSVTFETELCILWDAPRVVVNETSAMAFRLVPLPHRVVLLGGDEVVNDLRMLPDGDSRMVRFRKPELHRANRESGDVVSLIKKKGGELPTSELTKDISPGKPTLGTAVQSPGYTVSEEAAVGDNGRRNARQYCRHLC